MIDAQNKTTTLYSYQNGIGANTEAILNRTLRHILYGDEYIEEGGDFSAPYNLTVEFKMTNRLKLNWKLDGFVDEQRYYCSETPIDVNALPVPTEVLTGDSRSHSDTDIVYGKTYRVRIGSVKNNTEKISNEVVVDTLSDKAVALLYFDPLHDPTAHLFFVRHMALNY